MENFPHYISSPSHKPKIHHIARSTQHPERGLEYEKERAKKTYKNDRYLGLISNSKLTGLTSGKMTFDPFSFNGKISFEENG